MSLHDTIHKISSKISKDIDSRALNIIEFAESRAGLAQKLYPGQKFIFKLFYGIPLSDNVEDNEIIIRDQFNEEVLHIFSEVQFLDFLYQEKRINISPEDYEKGNLEFEEISFVIGRRGSKSTMTAIIACYTLYQLQLLENPHKYFEIFEEDIIGIAITANGKSAATKLFDKIATMIRKSSFFYPFIDYDGNGRMILHTKISLTNLNNGKDHGGNRIGISSFAASPSVRGDSNIVVIMDEFGHFIDSEASSKAKPLDKMMYEALTPSVSGFVDPDGNGMGKSFVISSPNGPKGELYSMFNQAFETKDSLVLNVPSNWINYKISSKRLRLAYNKSELSFRQEYRAEFIANESEWITNKDKVYAAVNQLWSNSVNNGVNGTKYYLGLDFGLSGDGSAFAVSHVEKFRPEHLSMKEGTEVLLMDEKVIVIDFIHYMLPEEGEILAIDDIVDYIVMLNKKFYIEKAIFDQWAGAIFEQLLRKAGVRNAYKVSMTQSLNSEIAQVFRQHLMDGRLMLPYDTEFVEEIFSLKEYVSRNGYVKVENVSNHDDRFDAVARAIYLASEGIENNTYISNMYNKSGGVKVTNAGGLPGTQKPMNKVINSHRANLKRKPNVGSVRR